jgi:hypothetical protein
VESSKSQRKKFERYLIGSFHVDLVEVCAAASKLYLFAAIERTSKFAFARWSNVPTPKPQ